ncbi:putative yD repeat protein [Bacillus clarus]|uniref:Putative yD repeat protein n=1 Tax=Bacillus clarus TaxID=2338372 RepID=A0A090YSQ2_9BACI|nr:putative yD repeat protein [Bacillus clarus]
MDVAGLTPFGKLAKVGKGVKNAEKVAEAKNIPGRGYHKEVYANKPVKVKDAVIKWDEFLGPGEHTNIHPRTELEDSDRIFSVNGTRSIRFGSHEMNSKSSKFHYHEEIWTYDPINNVMNVDNTLVRVPYK